MYKWNRTFTLYYTGIFVHTVGDYKYTDVWIKPSFFHCKMEVNNTDLENQILQLILKFQPHAYSVVVARKMLTNFFSAGVYALLNHHACLCMKQGWTPKILFTCYEKRLEHFTLTIQLFSFITPSLSLSSSRSLGLYLVLFLHSSTLW